MRSRGTKREPLEISVRLTDKVSLEAHSNGAIVACLQGYALGLGMFGATTISRAQELRKGLLLGEIASRDRNIDKETELLLRRLASHRLLEYCVGRRQSGTERLIVIEPQTSDYWPQIPQLDDADSLVLSRFAFMRRRDGEMVLESPCAAALFKLCDPKLASIVAMLSIPWRIEHLKRQDGFPGVEFLALLLDCEILRKIDDSNEKVQAIEEDDKLALWDFHDLVFHTRSTEGRHANPLGGVYPHSGVISPLPAARPEWPGDKIELCQFLAARDSAMHPLVKLLRDRHSTRSFDDRKPISLAELSMFLDGSGRILSRSKDGAGAGEAGIDDAVRPYPSAGASYELELYLAVNICEDLTQGFYHYDASSHRLTQIKAPANEVQALLISAANAMGAPSAPQILITIAARFGRVSWKYSSIAYSLILKDAGVLTQTFYLMATEMGLGGCAIGIVNIDQFAKMTELDYQVEGPVGQFALGRGRAE